MAYQSKKSKYKLYKMRAEGLVDIYRFLLLFAKKGTLGNYKIMGNGNYPDADIEFQCSSSLEGILRTLDKVPDGHVMMDTLKLKTEYTGER
jgi:hypothetical protein